MNLIKKTSLALIIGSTAFLYGCNIETTESARDKESANQEKIIAKANNKIPTYQPNNFLTRKAVDQWMKRMDTPDKTFFIYLLGMNGNHLGYYVGQTRPISTCTLLTPPDKLHYSASSSGKAYAVTDAPSLDGVYGGGGCDSSFFFFDAETDAYIEIQGVNYFVSDQPLSIDADPIKVK